MQKIEDILNSQNLENKPAIKEQENIKNEDIKIENLSLKEREELFFYDRDALKNYTFASLSTLNIALRKKADSRELTIPIFGKLKKISPEDLEKSGVLQKVYAVFQEFSEEIKNAGEPIENKDREDETKRYKISGENIEKLRNKLRIIHEAFYP